MRVSLIFWNEDNIYIKTHIYRNIAFNRDDNYDSFSVPWTTRVKKSYLFTILNNMLFNTEFSYLDFSPFVRNIPLNYPWSMRARKRLNIKIPRYQHRDPRRNVESISRRSIYHETVFKQSNLHYVNCYTCNDGIFIATGPCTQSL